MAGGKVKIDLFLKDFRAGFEDRALAAKHGLKPGQMIRLVKLLLKKGAISKEEYYGRRKQLEDLAIREEQNFLKSLYHCPVCSHVQPTTFDRCPACGTLTSDEKILESVSERDYSATGAAGPGELGRGTAADRGDRKAGALETVSPEILDGLRKKVGGGLTNLDILPEFADDLKGVDLTISELIGAGVKSAVFKAENAAGGGPPLTVKLFYPERARGANLTEVVDKILEYQSNMDDPNILSVIGTATLDESRVVLYEHLPINAEALLLQNPDGLPMDLILWMLPQILNGVGYAHMHRGKDGAIRRLAHVSLKPAKLLLDEKMSVAKVDEFGVCKALMEVRDYDPQPWEDLGVDPAGRAPESFVLDSKFVNLALMDIYALGVLLYRLVTGQPPFSCESVEEYRFAHLRKYPVPPRVHRYEIPLWLDEMILKCMEKEPSNRWRSATQMELAIGTETGKRTS